MFHLLTMIGDAGTFPMRRRFSSATDGGPARPNGSATPVARARRVTPVDRPPLLTIAADSALGVSWSRPILCCGLVCVALVLGVAPAQSAVAQSSARPSSRAEKIANALTAAPEEVTRDATVRDWPSKEGEGFALLRQGTNGWVCVPDDAITRGNDPMCLDETFYGALEAYIAGRTPTVTRVGYAYMLSSDAEGSNIDPMARAATPTNQWHHAGPHVMVLLPDTKLLDGLPTSPSAFGPYVMFPGTPIAHVMLPVQSGYAHSGAHGTTGDRSTRASSKHP